MVLEFRDSPRRNVLNLTTNLENQLTKSFFGCLVDHSASSLILPPKNYAKIYGGTGWTLTHIPTAYICRELRLLRKCAQHLHALKLLRAHGMCEEALQQVFRAVIISATPQALGKVGVLHQLPIDNTWRLSSAAVCVAVCVLQNYMIWLNL